MASNSPSSSAARSALLAGASFGALLPPPGLPALACCAALLEALGEEALLADALDADALLADEELLDEDELLDEEALFSSSEKSTSFGGWPLLSLEGSGGISVCSGCGSESLTDGLDDFLVRALGSGMLSLAELLLRRLDSSPPLFDAVLLSRLDSRPDSIDGMEALGWLLVLPGIPWLGLLEELLEGMPAD